MRRLAVACLVVFLACAAVNRTVAIAPRPASNSKSTTPPKSSSAAAVESTAARVTARPATRLLRDKKPGPPPLGEGLPALDRVVNDGLKEWNIPGGAVAIVAKGRLVVARGYGLANVKEHEPVSLRTLFPTASVTKTVTAMAALRLVELGKLSLDEPMYPLLGKPKPLGRAALDPQVEKITVRQLLLHAGGWNSKIHPDILRQTQKIARLTGEKLPVSAVAVTRFGLSQPLDFAPGSESHYSNFGYFLLKRIVEHAAQQSYETFVRQEIFKPVGIVDMRLEQLTPAYASGESRRYRADGRELPGGREPIAAPAGSWLATIIDLARLMTALDGTRGKQLLSDASRAQMFASPPAPLSVRKSGSHVGLGWDVVHETAAGLDYHKSGSVAGVRVYIEHTATDIDWVLLLNSSGSADDQTTALTRLTEQLRAAIDAQTKWPERDLFESSGK